MMASLIKSANQDEKKKLDYSPKTSVLVPSTSLCLDPGLFSPLFCGLFPPFLHVLLRLLSDRDRFQLGTLSHSLNVKATGYQELSDWPAVAPDQSVRNVEVIEPVRTHARTHTHTPHHSHRVIRAYCFSWLQTRWDICSSAVVWNHSLSRFIKLQQFVYWLFDAN